MDKNTITGFVLMLALLVGYNWYYSPTEEEIAEAEAAKAALAEEEALKHLPKKFVGFPTWIPWNP